MNRKNLFESDREAARVGKARRDSGGVGAGLPRQIRSRQAGSQSRSGSGPQIDCRRSGARAASHHSFLGRKCKAIQDRFLSEQAAADCLAISPSGKLRERAKIEEEKTRTAYTDALWTADSLREAAEKEAADALDLLHARPPPARKRLRRSGNRLPPPWNAAS